MAKLSPETDPLCADIAKFVATKLNDAYPKELIVRSVKHYDAYNVPYQNYPLLKVYRTLDSYSIDGGIFDSQIGLAYCLLNAELDRLPGISSWVAENVILNLRLYSFYRSGYLEIANSIRANYRTLLQLNQLIYQIDFNFGIKGSIDAICDHDI